MNFSSKNFRRFLLAFIGLATCFGFLFFTVINIYLDVFISIAIAFLLSITMFYDPKKYEAAKKKAAQADLEKNYIAEPDSDENLNS